MPKDKQVTITATMPAPVALALAQFVKRVGFYELRANAKNDNETYLIRDGIDELRRALADAGYSPH